MLSPPGSRLFMYRASSGWLNRKNADWPKHSMHPAIMIIIITIKVYVSDYLLLQIYILVASVCKSFLTK